MTDLRDQLAEFEAAARRMLGRQPRLVLIHARAADCHPDRPVRGRGLCDPCYAVARHRRRLDEYPTRRTIRFRAEFVADYELLRSERYTRAQIAERLRMTRPAVDQAYLRAVRAGDLTPDRRTA